MVTGAVMNFILSATKIFVGLTAGSVAVMSDSINNLGDGLGCSGAAIGFAVEKKKPTERFPYGFGRLEYLMTLLISCMIIVVGGVFAYNSLDRIFYHPLVTFAWVNFGVIAATSVIKVVFGFVLQRINREHKSTVLKAETVDSYMDAAITAMTLLGYGLSRVMSFPIDAFIGVVISIVIIAEGVHLLVGAFKKLIGARDRRTDGLERLCKAQDGVESAEIQVHDYGERHAVATVAVVFSEQATERERKQALERIVRISNENGIEITITEKKENLL